jgi:transcriptional regulator with XRE-family HTH domain
VRWDETALVAFVAEVDPPLVRAVPVTLDMEGDDSAVVAPPSAHDLGVDVTIWVGDDSAVPMRVLEFKLGSLAVPSTAELAAGTTNWGPTDPRTRLRAGLQDAIESLADASWAPDASAENVDIEALLDTLDFDDVVRAVGSVQLASRLRRGEAELTEQQARRLADLLGVPTTQLMSATQPVLPDELVAAMDIPEVRARVDRMAQARNREEIETWRSCAYGVLALAAREHDRRQTFWEAKVRAYFDAVLPEIDKDPGR